MKPKKEAVKRLSQIPFETSIAKKVKMNENVPKLGGLFLTKWIEYGFLRNDWVNGYSEFLINLFFFQPWSSKSTPKTKSLPDSCA